MRADQAKTIPIDRYLDHHGFKPVKQRLNGRELWYHSPIRSGDSSPSFKVDTILNKWFDHGLGRGGNTLDLAIELCCSSVREALRHLERTGLYSPTGYRPPSAGMVPLGELVENTAAAIEKEKAGSAAFKLVHEGPVKHPALLQYLAKRKIDPKLAETYLKQIHFTPADGSKQFFAIGWKSGMGYEARNSLFKGYVGVGKGITYQRTPKASQCAIFEGFFDFLAYLSEHQFSEPKFSVIVLNSGALKARAIDPVMRGGYQQVLLFLDNDQMGDENTEFFQRTLTGADVRDMRGQYAGHKDYNAMTMAAGG